MSPSEKDADELDDRWYTDQGTDDQADELDEVNDSLVVAESLNQFSKGLWQIFLGAISAAVAVTLLVIVPLLKLPIGQLSMLAVVAAIASVWLVFSGKQQCWSFSLPMQRRYLLTWSFGFDVALILLRFSRRIAGNQTWVALGMAACSLLSVWFLLSFIAHLASTINATWERLCARFTQFTMVIGVIAFFISTLVQRAVLPLGAAKFWGLLAIVSFVLSFLTFCILCAQMSFALKRFSLYLVQTDVDSAMTANAIGNQTT